MGSQETGSEIAHWARTKVQPVYPDLARKLNLAGTVRIQIAVTPSGVVKDAKVLGGHPLLAGAALDAAKKWRFEPSATERNGVLDFKFESHPEMQPETKR
jgi:TonB family protein